MTENEPSVIDTLKAPSTYRKAILSLVVPLIGGFGAAFQDGHITGSEALATIGVALVAFAATFTVSND